MLGLERAEGSAALRRLPGDHRGLRNKAKMGLGCASCRFVKNQVVPSLETKADPQAVVVSAVTSYGSPETVALSPSISPAFTVRKTSLSLATVR